jgi:hypothetical protein
MRLIAGLWIVGVVAVSLAALLAGCGSTTAVRGIRFAAAPSNGISKDPAFWPIGVWLQDPTVNGERFKNLGVNLFIGLWRGPTRAQLAGLASTNLSAFADQNGTGLTNPDDDVIKAWTQADEPDNAQRARNGYGPCVKPIVIRRRYLAMKKADPTRPVYLNFGRGVAATWWRGRGVCRGRTAMYRRYSKGADILSFDVYPVNEGLPLAYVARGVHNLSRWGGGKPVYAFIETTSIDGRKGPSTMETKAETWMAIIHGATGIEYFCHVFRPTFVEAGCLAPHTASALKTQDEQIQRLAPVLNSPSVLGTRISASRRVDQMTKLYEGATYVFAVNTTPRQTSAKFAVAGSPTGTATAIGERRRIPVGVGVFTDTFGPYATHLYRIGPHKS